MAARKVRKIESYTAAIPLNGMPPAGFEGMGYTGACVAEADDVAAGATDGPAARSLRRPSRARPRGAFVGSQERSRRSGSESMKKEDGPDSVTTAGTDMCRRHHSSTSPEPPTTTTEWPGVHHRNVSRHRIAFRARCLVQTSSRVIATKAYRGTVGSLDDSCGRPRGSRRIGMSIADALPVPTVAPQIVARNRWRERMQCC